MQKVCLTCKAMVWSTPGLNKVPLTSLRRRPIFWIRGTPLQGEVQFSPVRGTRGTIRQRSSSNLCKTPSWTVLAWAGMSTLWCCLSAFPLPTTASATVPKVPWRMVLERLLRRVTCPNHASFRLLTVARSGSCGPTRELILLRTQSLLLCYK